MAVKIENRMVAEMTPHTFLQLFFNSLKAVWHCSRPTHITNICSVCTSSISH